MPHRLKPHDLPQTFTYPSGTEDQRRRLFKTDVVSTWWLGCDIGITHMFQSSIVCLWLLLAIEYACSTFAAHKACCAVWLIQMPT